MNFFFGIKFLEFSSNLKIPIFQNQGHKKSNYNLYCINIKDNKWNIELYSSQSTDDFYMVNNYDCNNDNIFFLASDNEILNYKEKGFKNLIKLNNFTLTSPAYRANLEINLKEGGFSSYQSEYPLQMINKKGSIVSPLNILTNKKNSKNYLIFKNIYKDPINEAFKGYFINLKSKKIIQKFELKTNYTNCIEIHNDLLHEEIYFFTKNYTGIPVYLSSRDKHLSFEHTHPPHEYILSEDKFKIVANFKKEFYEIIC